MNINLKNLSKEEFYYKYLTILNVLSTREENKLTESEINLLILFILLPDKFKYQRFSTLAKSKVQKEAKEQKNWHLSRVNINNKIYSMLDKGFLRRDEDSVVYLSPVIAKVVDTIDKAMETKEPFNMNFVFTW